MKREDITFPLFVRLDDAEVMTIESAERILYHLEAIDIENDEYRFWDADGRGLKILIQKGRISGFQDVENRMTLQAAFAEYANQLGVSLDTSGTPAQIWERLTKAKDTLPKRRGWFSRLFSRTQ